MGFDPNRPNPFAVREEKQNVDMENYFIEEESNNTPATKKSPAPKASSKSGSSKSDPPKSEPLKNTSSKRVQKVQKDSSFSLNGDIVNRKKKKRRMRESVTFYMRLDLLHALETFADDGFTRGDVLESILLEYADTHRDFKQAMEEFEL